MGTLKKVVEVLGRVLGAVFGANFHTAADFLTREYPYLAYGC